MTYPIQRVVVLHKIGLCSVVVLALIFLTACDSYAAWATAPTPTALPAGKPLFVDDFTKTPNGWGINSSKAVTVTYEQGGLRMLVNEAQTDGWSVAGKRFRDVTIEVKAERLAGPSNNLVGVICRYQDRGNFYLLFITSDGYYGIGKYAENSYRLLGADQLQYTSVIQPERSQYQIKAVCSENELMLYLDGWKLMEVEDDGFHEGDVGVIAGAYEEPGVDILFDYFVVSQP